MSAGYTISAPTVAQTNSTVTITFAPVGRSTFAGNETFTPAVRDASGNAIATTPLTVSPAAGAASAAATFTAPAIEQAVRISCTNNQGWSDQVLYTIGAPGHGGSTVAAPGVWTTYVQTYAPPQRLYGPNPPNPWNGFQYAQPSGFRVLSTDRRNDLFFATETVTINVGSADAATYVIRDHTGAVVQSGNCSAGGTISFTPPRNGWFGVQVYAAGVDATFGQSRSGTAIGVTPHSANLYDSIVNYWDVNQVPYGGRSIYSSPANTPENPGGNASGQFPAYAVFTGTITPSVTGTLSWRVAPTSASGFSGRLTIGGTRLLSLEGYSQGSLEFDGSSLAMTSGQSYPVTFEYGGQSNSGINYLLQYNTGSGWNTVPASWLKNANGNSGGLDSVYYGPIGAPLGEDAPLQAFLGFGSKRTEIINTTNAIPTLTGLKNYFQFLLDHAANQDPARKWPILLGWPTYRAWGATTSGALTGGTSTTVNVLSNPNTGIQAGSKIKFTGTGEIATVANTWSSSTPTVLPLTAAVVNSYASGVTVIADPATEDAQITAAAQQLAAWFPGVVFAFEPTNEPNGSFSGAGFVAVQQSFFNAVKAGAAGSASIVLGPGVVDIHNTYPVTAGTLDNWWPAFINAGGAKYLDAISAHAYNSTVFDLRALREQLSEFQAFLANNALASRVLWQTEQGTPNSNFGTFKPYRQLRMDALRAIVYEQYGFLSAHDSVWTTKDHGDQQNRTGAFPGSCADPYFSDTPPAPSALFWRQWADNRFGKPFKQKLFFGDADRWLVGSQYSGGSGTGDLFVFMSYADPDATLTVNVSGGNGQLNVKDWAGNGSTVTVTAGQATLSNLATPVFVQLQSGQTLTIPKIFYGNNVLLNQAASSTGSQTNLSLLTDGIVHHVLAGTARYKDGPTGTYPLAITIPLPSLLRVGRVSFIAPGPLSTPDDCGSQVLEWGWDYHDSGGWHTLQAAQSRLPIQIADWVPYTQTTVTDFSDHKHAFSFVPPAPVLADQLRLTIYRSGAGSNPSMLAAEGGHEGGGGLTPSTSIGQITAHTPTARGAVIRSATGAGTALGG